jgi:hypothetical protein
MWEYDEQVYRCGERSDGSNVVFDRWNNPHEGEEIGVIVYVMVGM